MSSKRVSSKLSWMLYMVAFVLLAMRGSTACGGSVSDSTTANRVRTANEPRQNDPTAVPPPSEPTRPPPPPNDPALLSALTSRTDGGTSTTAGSQTSNESEASPPQRVSARHVLIQWMGSERAASSIVRSREQALTVAEEVLRRARAGDDFTRLAIEYSDEPGAVSRGGSLGRFGRGQMVPAFEAVVFKLRVGEVSGIVETPFGYHIIQRTE